MNQFKKPAFLFLFACVFGTSFAATLFEDNFQDSVTSKANWIFPAAVKRQFTGGALSLQNTDPTYMWFVAHSFASPSPTFTISETITSDSEGVGLIFCKKNNDGIALLIGTNQNLYVWKYDTTSIQMLFNKPNSFVNKTVNMISISKQDSTFNVFCNGKYIGSFYCSVPKFLTGGDVGMVMPPQAQAKFNNFLMTDQPETGKPITAYIDTFSSGNTHGWYLSGLNGTASVSSGSFTITNTGVTPADPYVSGNFNKASLRVIATHKQGAGYYGLAFFILAPGPLGDTVKSYLFLVDSARDYASGLPDSPAIYAVQTSLVHGDKDTLEVLRFSNKYKFKINGAFMSDSFPLLAPGRIDVAGLYIGGKTTVSFEDFAVGGDSTGKFESVINFPRGHGNTVGPISRFMGNDFAVFDLRGRTIKPFNGDYLETIRRLPSGRYIVRPVQDKIIVPEKSFTNVK